jgi:DNA-binding IclR family transcriptional regulator
MKNRKTAGAGVSRAPRPLRRYSAPAAELTCRILRHLASPGNSASTLTQIAKTLRANTSSCLRVLRVLEAEQLVAYDPISRRFTLGTYLYTLGSRAATEVDFLRVTLAHMRDVSEATGLTCALSQRVSKTELMYVAKHEPRQRIHISMSVGEKFPAVAGSHAKCYLAFMSPAERDEVLDEVGLPAFTPKAIRDRKRYVRELDEVRERGYATSLGEWVPGVNGVSVPIRSQDVVLGVMSASSFSTVLTADLFEPTAMRLLEAAHAISTEIPSPQVLRRTHS